MLLLSAALPAACSQGEGSGVARGTLDVPDCWTGNFDLKPTFFAAVPSTTYGPLQIRIQNGGDNDEFSDGISILLDSIAEVQAAYGQTLVVSLPVGVTPPGVPVHALSNPPIVHATLYLQRSCRTQNVALHAMSAVSLNADGTCGGAAEAGSSTPSCPGPASVAADAGSAADASSTVATGDGGAQGAVGTSTIIFRKVFDGDSNESDADKRLTDVPMFDLYFADPREICPGGAGPPPRCRAHLQGYFSFYFERGQPAQPYP